MWRSGLAVVLFTGLGAGIASAASGQEADPGLPEPTRPEPIRVDKLETEQVHLLLVDVVVVDGAGRTVADLGVEDFEVLAAGKPVAVDTLDVDCPAGASEDVRAVSSAKRRQSQAVPGAGRRIVLALDYEHLGQLRRAQVLDDLRRMVANDEVVPGEELMLVALNGGLRIEQAFTGDRAEVLRSLRRMEYDISLWMPSFHHSSAAGFVNGLTALFDVLATYPDHKAVVLFSEMTGVPLDRQFREIAAQAAVARCSVYPVDAMGLRDHSADGEVLTGGCGCTGATAAGRVADKTLTSLAQLATDTGGRFSERTNDLTLGYARSQRDLACVYSLGFYLQNPEEDHAHDLVIRVRRPGLRAIHPSRYLFRSAPEKQQSLLRAAWIAPERFQTGVVRAHLFPLRPESKKQWEALLAVSFPVPLAETGGAEAVRQFGAVLTEKGLDGERVVHRFARTVTLRPHRPDVTAAPLVTFLEPVSVKPGDYTVTAVLEQPGAVAPHASKVQLSVGEIPTDDLFLVGPLLGDRAGTNLVVLGGSSAEGDTVAPDDRFSPLMIQQVEDQLEILALTQACTFRGKKFSKRADISIHRALRGLADAPVGELPPVPLALDTGERVSCQNLLDVVPAVWLDAGDYVFEASFSEERDARAQVRFTVGIEEPAPGPR